MIRVRPASTAREARAPPVGTVNLAVTVRLKVQYSARKSVLLETTVRELHPNKYPVLTDLIRTSREKRNVRNVERADSVRQDQKNSSLVKLVTSVQVGQEKIQI